MRSKLGIKSNRFDMKSVEFVRFISLFIQQLGCDLEHVDDLMFLVKKAGRETGVEIELTTNTTNTDIGRVTVEAHINEKCFLPFDDARFFKHAETEEDMPKVVASYTDPKEIGLLLELICKAIYFSDVNLRTWKCADCETEGIEIFLQDGTITTIDEDTNTFYLVASKNEQEHGGFYDEMTDQYVLALCLECFHKRGYSPE